MITPKTLPRDRILSGDLRNDTLKEVDLTAAKDVELLDRRGRSVAHTTIFTEGFSRDIYPPRYRRKVPLQDQLRLGRGPDQAGGERARHRFLAGALARPGGGPPPDPGGRARGAFP